MKALERRSPEHYVDTPIISRSGLMGIALRASERREEASNLPEIKLVTEYLEADCRGLWQILHWPRGPTAYSCDSTTRAVEGRVTTSTQTFCWYKWARLLAHTKYVM